MFRLVQHFSLVSACATFVVVGLLMLFFRQLSIEDITNISERQNGILARSLGNHLREIHGPLGPLFKELGSSTPQAKHKARQVSKALADQLRGLPVIKVAFLDLDGRVVLSTDPVEILTTREKETAFLGARDDQRTTTRSESENQRAGQIKAGEPEILSNYIPLEDQAGGLVGIAQISSDPTPLRADIDKHVTHVFIVLLVALGLLYLVLFQVVRRADRTIKEQHTNLQHSEASLRQALDAAEEANQAKSRFMATVSHEFRTPLNAIIGFSEILSSQRFGPLGDKKYNDYAVHIRDSGDHMLALVNDVLDLSVIESHNRSASKAPVAVDAVLQECKLIIEQSPDAVGVSISFENHNPIPMILADQRSLYQIFTNLLSNAVKFTEPKGHVAIHVTHRDEEVIIRIEDSGIGIPEANLARITDAFFQVNSDPLRSNKGSGLGLAIVKSLVDAHDGKLDIQSIEGEGTVVTVVLPCSTVPGGQPI